MDILAKNKIPAQIAQRVSVVPKAGCLKTSNIIGNIKKALFNIFPHVGNLLDQKYAR